MLFTPDNWLDDLARETARLPSRRDVLRRFGLAAGAALALAPLPALASESSEEGPGNSPCAHFCDAVFPPGPERGVCKSQAAQGRGLCFECGPAAAAGHGQVCGTPTDRFCCPPGQSCCQNTHCVDLLTDVANCGACGNACAAGKVCLGGKCVCPAGTTACGTQCVNLATDVANCGACGHACTSGKACLGGQCVCPPGTTGCGGACCSAGQVCVNGVCTTPAPVCVGAPTPCAVAVSCGGPATVCNCLHTAEGGFACVNNVVPPLCDVSVQTCAATSDCPAGFVCVVSCCEGVPGRCAPACTSPALAPASRITPIPTGKASTGTLGR